MASSSIASAMARVNAVLRKHPRAGIVEDAPALSAWCGGLRVSTQYAGGAQTITDMPVELGGSGDQPSPGWLLRAALASCAVTRIAMAAAEAGIDLQRLEASAHSRSDARGLLGLPDSDGMALFAGPGELTLRVQIAATGVAPERLRMLVDQAIALAPISQALAQPLAVALQVEICTDLPTET
ncbi:OsmC family protein [Roseateles oligotrophus]|uniref:OsmC family protein n=1 Tax=Roseateles oligotrophus TaxID=1769250 RepID=A0ABT2YCC4_9BURK|nr:OsmC family protein [Roseateles oligotrophus]MCV2367698.1 OsmC family protein [Roseateles oligotrophus]